jgi:hypothetical protein
MRAANACKSCQTDTGVCFSDQQTCLRVDFGVRGEGLACAVDVLPTDRGQPAIVGHLDLQRPKVDQIYK